MAKAKAEFTKFTQVAEQMAQQPKAERKKKKKNEETPEGEKLTRANIVKYCDDAVARHTTLPAGVATKMYKAATKGEAKRTLREYLATTN